MICPSCLSPLNHDASVCTEAGCGTPIPSNYREALRAAPPLPIAAVGLSGHGKTHLLATLVRTLEDLPERLPGFTCEMIGDPTLQKLREWRIAELQRRELPRTKADGPRIPPLIIRTSGLRSPRTLLIFDVAGEDFEKLAVAHDRLPALRGIRTIWFVVSPFDLQNPQEKSLGLNLGTLFMSYRDAMSNLGASLEGRRAVVVFTRGDKLASEAADPLIKYLDSDPFAPEVPPGQTASSLPQYEASLREMSSVIKTFNRASFPRDGTNFVNLIEQAKMQVEFCVTAPLGQDTEGVAPDSPVRKTPGAWRRLRVLDPLFWTLLVEDGQPAEGASSARTIHLILDAGSDAPAAYPPLGGLPLPEAIRQALARNHTVHAWFLGHSRPAATGQNELPNRPPTTRRARLLGPLLEGSARAGSVVVFSHGNILDLADFRRGGWPKRMVLINTSTRAAEFNDWERSVTLEANTSVADILALLDTPA